MKTHQSYLQNALFEQEGVHMSEYNRENRCHECDGTGGHHYPGCTYEGTEGHRSYSSGSGDQISTFCFIMSFIGGVLGVSFIYTIFGVDAEDVPAFLSIILVIIFAAIICVVVGVLNDRK